MWSKTQADKFRRALAVAEKHAPTVANYEQLAAHSPQLAQLVDDFKARRENLETLSKIALSMVAQT